MASSRPASAASGMRPCFMSAHARQRLIAGDLRRNRAGELAAPGRPQAPASAPPRAAAWSQPWLFSGVLTVEAFSCAGSTTVRLLAAPTTQARPGIRQPCRASSASVGIADAEVQVDGSRSRESSSGPQRTGPPAAVVTFRARRKLKYGQVLKVVGGPPQMGGWDCGRAPGEYASFRQLPPVCQVWCCLVHCVFSVGCDCSGAGDSQGPPCPRAPPSSSPPNLLLPAGAAALCRPPTAGHVNAVRPSSPCPGCAVMKWGEGDRWMITLELPPGQHEYKVRSVCMRMCVCARAHALPRLDAGSQAPPPCSQPLRSRHWAFVASAVVAAGLRACIHTHTCASSPEP